MAPGCSMSNEHSQSHNFLDSTSPAQIANKSTNQIPLPPTPAPYKCSKPLRKCSSFRTLDTVDSFEILEQTIMKQKRLGRTKNTDMRMKILLKRTFNLVCEMMDKENGFDSNSSEEDEIKETQDNMEETLIINLSETESLDMAFQTSEEMNYIDLENFNYENLLEDSSLEIEKNKSFLSTEFFQGEVEEEEQVYGRFKRRRSSGDDDIEELENEFEHRVESSSCQKSYYLFNDLTNSGSKKRCLNNGDESIGVKKFKESVSNSINIVT